jgi:hypothetical protein
MHFTLFQILALCVIGVGILMIALTLGKATQPSHSFGRFGTNTSDTSHATRGLGALVLLTGIAMLVLA